MTSWQLPTYKGYAVDLRLKEFRKAELDEMPEFIPFCGERGVELFTDWLTEEPKQFLAAYEHYWGSDLPPKVEWTLIAAHVQTRLRGEKAPEHLEAACGFAISNVCAAS